MRKPVLVTTQWKGVFFGFMEDNAQFGTPNGSVKLQEVQCAVYWQGKGFVELSTKGPSPDSRVTDASPEAILYGVTGIFDCTEEAVKAWQKKPWRG